MQALYDDDLAHGGFVWNVSRLWAHQPDSLSLLFTLMSQVFAPSGLRFRQRGMSPRPAARAISARFQCRFSGAGQPGPRQARGEGAEMTGPGTGSPQWVMAAEGWCRKTVDFSTLSEPGNCREYVLLHHRLGVDAGDRLLDVACGSGLAIELARLRGAACSGIDASARLVAVARDRNPECDIRADDMRVLPWRSSSFDVVTSFRGIWGTAPIAVGEIYRVLRPGGRVGITVWGRLRVSAGAWAMEPLQLAAADHVASQAMMAALAMPGAGERLLESHGFVDVERVAVPFAWEFADPQLYARALASTGPAHEAIQNVGRAEFHRAAVEAARGQLRDGLPLRADIDVVGFLARKPADMIPLPVRHRAESCDFTL